MDDDIDYMDDDVSDADIDGDSDGGGDIDDDCHSDSANCYCGGDDSDVADADGEYGDERQDDSSHGDTC